jgi:predicted dehydrogenase
MYRDFVGAIREGRQPAMSLERAMEDQRLMEQIYATAEAGQPSGAMP